MIDKCAVVSLFCSNNAVFEIDFLIAMIVSAKNQKCSSIDFQNKSSSSMLFFLVQFFFI